MAARVVMVNREVERERLVDHICESIRVVYPRIGPDDYYRLRTRLQKTGVTVLRQIVEEDVVNIVAGVPMPVGVASAVAGWLTR